MRPMKCLAFLLLVSGLSSSSMGKVPPPVHLQGQFSDDGLNVTWVAPDFPSLKGFNIYIKRPGADAFKKVASQAPNDTMVLFKHMKPGAAYEIAVSSIGASGRESVLKKLKVAGIAAALPPPGGFNGQVTEKGILLTWDKADPVSVSGFNLYLTDEAGKPIRKLNQAPLTDNQVSLTKLKRDKTYYFTLTALAPDGRESAPTQVWEGDLTGNPLENYSNQSPETAAQERPQPVPEKPEGPWYVSLAGGADLPAQNWQSAYVYGPGGEITLGYEMAKNLAIQLDVEGYYFSGTNYSGAISDIEIHVLPSLRYIHRGQGINTYLLAGGGADMEMLSASSGTMTLQNLDAAVGAGLEFSLGGHTYVFAEGKLNFIFYSGVTSEDVPISAGFRFGL